MNWDFLELSLRESVCWCTPANQGLKCTGRRVHRQDGHKFEAILVYIAIFRLGRVI